MSQAAPKSRGHPSLGAASAPRTPSRPWGGAGPPRVPGRHAVPELGPPPRQEPAPGSSQLLTAFISIFLNTCSFMKTITLARSKHIQTNLLYDTRGCQRNGGKSLYSSTQRFQHSHREGKGRPGPLPQGATPVPPGLQLPELGAGWGYLAVIFIHISAFRGKNKRFLPNQQANLMQTGRAAPCSPRPQHPPPVLPAGQPPSPGSGGQATSPSRPRPLRRRGGRVSPSVLSLLSWGGEHCPCQGWASKGPHRGSRELTGG